MHRRVKSKIIILFMLRTLRLIIVLGVPGSKDTSMVGEVDKDTKYERGSQCQ
jgi:hypothetical protein